MNYVYFIIRITVCCVLGIAIGLERQFRRKTAGIRTITLVSLGAFLFTSLSLLTKDNDITRMAAQVVSGIGFLGAGVIIQDGLNIRGLNTAATLWCSAAIGTITAMGFLIEAIIGVVFILLANMMLRIFSRKFPIKSNKDYIIIIEYEETKEENFRNIILQKLKSFNIGIKQFISKKIDNYYQLEITIENYDKPKNVINKLCNDKNIRYIKYKEVNNNTDDDDDDFDQNIEK